MVIVLVGLLKLPLVALLLWLPFRDDPLPVDLPDSSSQDDGGSKVPPDPRRPRHPRSPLPRLPRRGPHGGTPAASPARIRALRAHARSLDRELHGSLRRAR
jgi:hypothetical protein